MQKACDVGLILMFIANKLNEMKYTGLLERHVSAIESSFPQGVHFTKGVWVLKTGPRRW